MKNKFYILVLSLIMYSCGQSKPDHYGVYLNNTKTELVKYRYNNGYEGTEILSEQSIKVSNVLPKLIVFSSEPIKESTFELWGEVKKLKNNRLSGNGNPKLFQIKKIDDELYELKLPNLSFGTYSLYKPEEKIGYIFKVVKK